jgi:RimJ/RimL family protein N-acetyltransferase
MRHDIHIEGDVYRVRPVEDGDAPFIVSLRGMPELSHYLHASARTVEEQLAWQANYYQRAGDYYFVVERRQNDAPEGLVSLYDVNPDTKDGEWGRWILKPGSLAAVESALLVYRVAFDLLGLNKVCSRTVADNVQVVSFHDSCGIPGRRILPGYFILEGRQYDAVEHCADSIFWAELEQRLGNLARLIARKAHSV